MFGFFSQQLRVIILFLISLLCDAVCIGCKIHIRFVFQQILQISFKGRRQSRSVENDVLLFVNSCFSI